MAIINRPRFKISQDPGSNKVQGLRVGDVVLRQYFDNTTQFYSLMLVDEIGGTQATGSYFVAQLIDGDEPGATGSELLDFVRVTNIIDEGRMGAVYISGSGENTPRIDALDAGGKEASIVWPTFVGVGGYEFYNDSGIFGSGVMTDIIEFNTKRGFKITRNSTTAPNAWSLRSRVRLGRSLTVGKQYTISYRYRANKEVTCPAGINDLNGSNQNAQWVDNFTKSWQYKTVTFSAEYVTDETCFASNLASVLSSGDWVEYADFTVVPVDALKTIRSSVKSCVGNMRGIVDPIFGQLQDYGGYFQRLYATKDVNIAGTLTAGDENGFGTTFYAGKIAKNMLVNSDLRPENTYASLTTAKETGSLPTGIVGDFTTVSTTVATNAPRVQHFVTTALGDNWYTYSVWMKAPVQTKIQLILQSIPSEGDIARNDIIVDNVWRRYSITQYFRESADTQVKCIVDFVDNKATGNKLSLWGYQFEAGRSVTPYQPTDGTLSSSTDYGMWANRGGFGGTIQNPILKLQPDGTIVGGNNKLILRPDGSAEFNGTVVISGSGGQPLDVEQAINQAKSEAISTSSTDATTKANQAKIDAEAAAALDAAQKATQAKNDAISSAATDATNKAVTAKSEAISAASQDATTKANGAVTTALANTVTEIGKIANGDRNLYLNSGVEFGDNDYGLGSKAYSTYERRKGALYTITMCYTLGENNSYIGVYQDSGSIHAASFSTRGERVVESKTFQANNTTWGEPSSAGFYQFPNGTYGSRVHWVTIVEGTKAPTTFIPAPEDIDANINTQFNASKQFATDSITDLKNNYLGDLALMDTLDGGKITDGTIAFAKLGSTIISGGYIKTELLDANAIRTNIINVNYIEGLSLNFVRGMIGGWLIGDNTISSGGVAISSTLRSMFVTKPSGGHSTVGQTYVGGAWTGKYGFASTNASGQVLFRADEAANVIGGWNFDTSKLYSGAIELGSSGYIRNTSDKWRLNNDGSGQLAAGNIGWDAAGNVTFGANVQLNWKSYTDSAVAGVVVGGRNILRGSKCIVNGAIANVYTNGAALSVDSTITYNGEPTMKVVGANGFYWANHPLLEPGVEYTISMMVKSDSALNGSLDTPLHIQIPAGSHEYEGIIKADSSLTTEWKQIYLVVKNTSSDPQRLNVYLYGISDRVVNVAWVKVEKGNKATDWTAAPEDSDYLKTHIDANGIYTGTLTTQQLNAAAATVLGNVTAGSFNIGSGKFLVDAGGNLTAVGANVSGTITSESGKIGGWSVSKNAIESNDRKLVIESNVKSIYVEKPSGGHVALGQTFIGASWTGKYGFSATDASHRPLIRMDEAVNQIAGWSFDYSKLSSGTIEISSTGYIRNTADKWRLNNDGSVSFASGKFTADAAGNAKISGWTVSQYSLASEGDKSQLRANGSGQLASGNILWDVDGNVTLGSKVKLAWGTDSKNLVDWSEWTVGAGGTLHYSINGTIEENSRAIHQNPFSVDSIMWKCTANVPKNPDGTNITGPDGGFNTSSFDIDKRYPYRFCVWVNKEDSTGTSYFGCGQNTVSNLTGSNIDSVNNNPYFVTHKISDDGEWYLMVGFVHPEGYVGAARGISGLYGLNGEKVVGGNEFRWTHTSTTTFMRAYLFYATITGEIQWLYNPIVHKIDGTEPSLSQIINNRIVTTNIDANGIYTGTLNANQITAGTINADRIIAGSISTDKLAVGSVTGDKIAAGTITADKIKVDQLVVSKLDGATGSFKKLNCINDSGQVLGAIEFGSDGKLWFSGDMYHQGTHPDRRAYRFYAADLWCRGEFGHSTMSKLEYASNTTDNVFFHIFTYGTNTASHKYAIAGQPVDCIVLDGRGNYPIRICDSSSYKMITVVNNSSNNKRVVINQVSDTRDVPPYTYRVFITAGIFYDVGLDAFVNALFAQ